MGLMSELNNNNDNDRLIKSRRVSWTGMYHLWGEMGDACKTLL
jgi:hypothetical protein